MWPGSRRVDGYDPAVIFDAASDGRTSSSAMLIVGLVFLAVIGLGELAKAAVAPAQGPPPQLY